MTFMLLLAATGLQLWGAWRSHQTAELLSEELAMLRLARAVDQCPLAGKINVSNII